MDKGCPSAYDELCVLGLRGELLNNKALIEHDLFGLMLLQVVAMKGHRTCCADYVLNNNKNIGAEPLLGDTVL